MENSKSPLVAIIVPLYNTEKYIAECIQSIKDQSYANFICIIVNDGSTDSSKLKAQDTIGDDTRFILINKENKGVSHTRNVALDYIENLDEKVDYISFVDSDDVIKREFIEKLLKAIIDNNADLAVCGITEMFKNEIITDKKSPNYQKLDQKQLIEHAFSVGDFEGNSDMCSFMGLVNKLFKAEKILEHRFSENKKNSEDILFLFGIYDKIFVAALVNDCLYLYRMRKSSTTHIISPLLQAQKDIEIYETILSSCDNQNLRNVAIAKYYLALYSAMREAFLTDKKLAKQYFLKLRWLFKQYKDLCPKKILKYIKRLKFGWHFTKIYPKIRNFSSRVRNLSPKRRQNKQIKVNIINQHKLYD